MASTQTWSEGNGANAATETTNRAEMNWKNIDDSTTAYSASPITAGNNSFHKIQAVKFAGTYNSLSALSFYASTAAPGTGLSVVASVRSSTTGATPATTATGDSAIPTSAGTLTANFVATSTWASAFAAGTTSVTASAAAYSQPLRTQLQTTGSAAPGDITSVTITASWTES